MSKNEDKNPYSSLTGLLNTMASKFTKDPEMRRSCPLEEIETSEDAGAQALPLFGRRTDFVYDEGDDLTKKRHNSDNEEEVLIEQNLDHICGFLSQMQNRRLERFSPRVTTKLDLVKLQWDKLVKVSPSVSDDCSDHELMV